MRPDADHLLHFTPSIYGGTWRLECLPGDGHFTVHDLEEWSDTAEQLESEGYTIDRSHCWVHDWLDNADHHDEWMKCDDWHEDGPWYVVCSFDGGLNVSPAADPYPTATTTP